MGAMQQALEAAQAATTTPTTPTVGSSTYAKGACWDGQGYPLTTSVQIVRCLPCQAAGTIVSATAEGDVSGTCAVEVWKTTYAGAPATVADKISGSNPISLSGSAKSLDVALTGWTTTVAHGDIIAFKLSSVSTLGWLTVGLEIQ